MSRVIAPPYDVISKSLQNELYKKDPHNVVRLILNKSNNRYTRAKKFLDAWLAEDILKKDNGDSFYIYSQKYKRGLKTVEEVGFIGLMGLEMGGRDKVLPHENTLAAPKKDRLSLMRAVRANLEPIFILHDDNVITKALRRFCTANRAIIDVTKEGVRHIVWKMDEPATIHMIEDRMKGKNVFIADGHHRFEVANMYSKEARDSAAKYIMVYFVETDENMLTVLPTYRMIKKLGKTGPYGIINKLSEFFHIEEVSSLNKMAARLGSLARVHAFGLYLGRGKFYILKLKDIVASDKAIKDKPKDWKHLDVSILHLFIFQHILGIKDVDENIEFSKSMVETAKCVDSGKFKAAFFLNPTKVSQVKRIAKLGERMPRKSTYFYPKQLSGLVINKF